MIRIYYIMLLISYCCIFINKMKIAFVATLPIRIFFSYWPTLFLPILVFWIVSRFCILSMMKYRRSVTVV